MSKRARQQGAIGSLEEMTRRAQTHPLVGREQEVSRLQQALLETERRVQTQARTSEIPEPQSWVMPSRAPLYLLSGISSRVLTGPESSRGGSADL